MKTREDRTRSFSRRDFIKVSASVGAGIMFSGNILVNKFSSLKTKKRYAIIGMGSRAEMWLEGIYNTFYDECEVVGFCDTNIGRIKHYQDYTQKMIDKKIPGYEAKDFDKMINETKPDTIIVLTVDSTHHLYIVRAMELGCDVITEKPMTNTEKKCQQIIDAQKK